MDEDRLVSPSVVRGMMTLSTLVAQALLIKPAFRESCFFHHHLDAGNFPMVGVQIYLPTLISSS